MQGEEAAAFKKFPAERSITTMAATEDGKFLILGHEPDGKLTIWDAATQKLIKELECAAPRYILSRGEQVFVVNFGKGTISIFDIAKDWELVNQIEAGMPEVTFLSAPGGKYFTGQLLASGLGNRHELAVILIDVKKDAPKTVFTERMASTATLDHEGRYFFAQSTFGTSPSGTIRNSLEYPAILKGRKNFIGSGEHKDTPLLRQTTPGPYWFGGNSVFQGTPPKPSGEPRGKLVIPDQRQPVFYVLDEKKLRCVGISSDFPELGARDVSYPKDMERMSSRRHPYAKEFKQDTYFHHLAITLGEALAVYILDSKSSNLYYATTPRFALSNTLAKNIEFPKQIAEGKRFTFKLSDGKDKGQYELVSGPEGAKLTGGELTWTPTKKDLGKQVFKIRSRADGKISFQRFDSEVVDAARVAAAGGDLEKLKSAGQLTLDDPLADLKPSLDMKAVLVLAGSRLMLLDSQGLFVTQTLDLPKPYKRIAERPAHYVALADHSLDILDKKTCQVKKSIALPGSLARDLALHPARGVAYATIINDDGGRREGLEANRVVEIDESTGQAKELPRTYGSWVAADPAGQYLYVALRGTYVKGVRLDWNIGGRPDFGDIDVLARYDMSGPTLKHVDTNLAPGTRGVRLIVAPDGQHLAYVSLAGNPAFSFMVPAFKRDNIKNSEATYKAGEYPLSLSFHPTLGLVATANSRDVRIFDRSTGKQLKDKIQFQDGQQPGSDTNRRRPFGVTLVSFTPDGKHILLGSQQENDEAVRDLRSFALLLTEEEEAQLGKPFRAPRLAAQRKEGSAVADSDSADASGGALGKSVSVKQIEAAEGRGAIRDISTREISQQFMGSVVLVEGENRSGTGIVIGSGGFILTCAHVLPSVGDPSVSYQFSGVGGQRVEKAPAEIYRLDKEHDLALLKIKPKGALRTVQFNIGSAVESGEEVTVIGNPGVGDTILTNTVTAGIVSSPHREIDGQPYVQTSAPINRGNSGGPMFNRRGQMIGVVVAKASIENTGFAIPMEMVLKFLDVGVKLKGGAAKTDELAPVAQKKSESRIWTDISGKQVKATLVEVRDGKAVLRKPDGQEISVPVGRFSDVDQDVIKRSQ